MANTPKIGDLWFRCEGVVSYPKSDEYIHPEDPREVTVMMRTAQVVKVTDCTVMLQRPEYGSKPFRQYIGASRGRWKPSVEAAKTAFLPRAQRRVMHLTHQLADAREILAAAEAVQSGLKEVARG